MPQLRARSGEIVFGEPRERERDRDEHRLAWRDGNVARHAEQTRDADCSIELARSEERGELLRAAQDFELHRRLARCDLARAMKLQRGAFERAFDDERRAQVVRGHVLDRWDVRVKQKRRHAFEHVQRLRKTTGDFDEHSSP